MTLLIYLLKTILISGLLLAYYGVALKNKPFHRYNRFFLLGIPVFSLLLPLFRLSLPHLWGSTGANGPIRLLGVAGGTLEEAVTVYARQDFWNSLPWEAVFTGLSIGVSLFFGFRLYRSLRQLRLLRRNNPCREIDGARICFVRREGTPFSFFNTIFWNEGQDLNDARGRQILRHELYHVRHQHSLDILLLEVARILCWFNPFIHLIRREIQAIHEFSADAFAASGGDRLEYAELLLMNSLPSPSLALSHPFFQNPIKRRIAMITNNKKINSGLLGRMMVLPLAALLLGLFSFKHARHSFLPFAVKTIRVVIDAGHGGSYTGVQANGILEKDLDLQIAKKIRQLAGDYQVDVIMTREDDGAPGHFANLRDDLAYRASLPGKEHADLFISIHCNEGLPGDAAGGFEIYVPHNRSSVYEGSVKLGSGIAGFIRRDHSIAPELKQAATDIHVLDAATVPAVLILCGSLDKKPDLDFISNEQNQEKIARDILEGIRMYALETSTYTDHFAGPGDTITLDQANPDSIASIDVYKKHNLILVRFKNGRSAIVKVTEEMKKEWKAASDTLPVFTKVEIESGYPGGQDAWAAYLIKNLKYPAEAIKKGTEGDVVVQFIVQQDGSVTDIRAISGPESLRAESERVIRESGKWIPAKNNGKIVRSYKKQPIVYRLKSA